jgi:hypothetical protein
MDAATLTNQVMTTLAPVLPYLSSAGTAIAGKIGEDAYQQARKLYEAIRTRFAKEPDNGKASTALQAFVADPDLSGSIQIKLQRLIESDPIFADTLRQIILSGPRQSLTADEEAEARHIRMTNTLGIGDQDIKGGKRAKIEDVEMNINHE